MIDPNIPLIDLHRHLDGSLRLETILDLGQIHNLPLPSFQLEELRPYVQVTEPQPGVMAFIARFEWMVGVLVDLDACRRIAYENIEDAWREGIDYIELRFSPYFMAQPHGLSAEGVVEAVVDGLQAGVEEFGIQANLIGIISRHYGPEIGMLELDAILSRRNSIVALDLAGDEAGYPGELFVSHFSKARDAGLRITVHAGEAAGPESVWQAINGLGAERIGHATRINEDPKLVETMSERGIGIEANLTSNVQTSTISSYIAHPLKGWLESGLLATINSDDPGISAIDLPFEFNVAAPKAGLTPELISLSQQNAVQIAFMTAAQREGLTSKRL